MVQRLALPIAVAVALGLLATLALTSSDGSGHGVRLDRVHELAREEGVYGYARISPDGRFLAYASEIPGRARPLVTLIDLASRAIVFSETGIDPYFSPDGERLIYLSQDELWRVSIRHRDGRITREVATTDLGDYYSWGVRADGRDVILTVAGRFFELEGDLAVLPAASVEPCPDIGTGERPLISREADRISVFVRGTVVVRDLIGCNDVIDTGLEGAKADFAWGGRYLAFHAPKPHEDGYRIEVVDLEERTVRTIADLAGSCYFPSWTRDGRLSFRCDGPDYRGFVIASEVLSAPARPLPSGQRPPAERRWSDIFPETPRPAQRLALVLVWGPWSAHSRDALRDLERARDQLARRGADVAILHAIDPGSFPGDGEWLLEREGVSAPHIPLAAERRALTEVHNQNPTTLLFRHGLLVDRRMGAQTTEDLLSWVEAALRP